MIITKRLKGTVLCAIEAIAVLTLFGCASILPSVPTSQPLEIGPEGSVPITFTRLIIRVPSGTQVGAHHDGLLQVPKFYHHWQSNIAVASDEYKIVASEHLKSRGYAVMGGDNLLFGKDESAKAQYQLGGTVQTLQYNTYAPLAGNYSESTLTIEWQLYDVFRELVVHKGTTQGYGRQQGIGSACIQTAFLSSLDNLLADSNFVSLLRKTHGKETDERSEYSETIKIAACHSEKEIALPKDLETVLSSVIVIQAGQAIGSGVLISSDGWALTAAHVVSGIEDVLVRLRSGIELKATISRIDTKQDVALIRLPGRGYPCLALAANEVPNIGSDLFAVGAPAGEELAFSVTKGIVSGFREWEGKRYIQTDAALSPGNSGGPLLSANGLVIGIVSWKIVASGFEGLAFGVPAHTLLTRLNMSLE